MADPIRLQVLKALTSLLETIVPSAPTVYPPLANLSGKVFRGRSVFSDSDPSTMLSILEAPRPGGAVYAGDAQARSEDWLLLIQGWCQDDKLNPSDPIYFLVEDVERCLDRITDTSNNTGYPKYPEHYMLGNLIRSFQVSQPVVRPPTKEISSKSFFYLPVQVGLARIARE